MGRLARFGGRRAAPGPRPGEPRPAEEGERHDIEFHRPQRCRLRAAHGPLEPGAGGPFIEFAGVADGERVLDVGCGTGSLTFALPQAADVAEVAAIDFSPVFVPEAQRRNTDPRITIARAMPAPSRSRMAGSIARCRCSSCISCPRPTRRSPRCAASCGPAAWSRRPSGTISAGMPGMRMMWDTVAVQDEEAPGCVSHYCFQPMMRPDELRQSFVAQGLVGRGADLAPDPDGVRELRRLLGADRRRRGAARQVRGGARPGAPGQGGRGGRAAYEAGQPDGPRSFAAVAWACRAWCPARVSAAAGARTSMVLDTVNGTAVNLKAIC